MLSPEKDVKARQVMFSLQGDILLKVPPVNLFISQKKEIHLPIRWEKVAKGSRIQGFKCLFLKVLSVSQNTFYTKTNYLMQF